MSDTKAAKASLGYTIGNYLLKGLTFLTVPVFARLLSTEDFGVYSTFVAYEAILYVIIGLAIHSSYKNAKYRYDINESANNEQLNYQGYKAATVVLLAGNTCLVLLLVNLLYPTFKNVVGLNRLAVNLLVIYSSSTVTLSCFNADASLNYDYKSYLRIAVFNAIGNLGLSILFILTIYSSQRYMGRIVGTVVPMGLIAIYIFTKFYRVDKKKNVICYLKWGLTFSIPIVFHGISQVILSQFDRIMIRSISGDTAVGLYSFGYTIFSIINVTFNSTDAVWSTWFYEKLNKDHKEAIRQYSTYYIYFVLILCILLMLICPELIVLLGSSKYIESKYCTIPIIASGFFVFMYTLPSGVEYYYEKTKKIAFATILAAIINVILNYVYIYKYGYVAAAYTTLFTYVLYFIFHYIQARKITGYSVFSNVAVLLSSILTIVSMSIALLLIEQMWLRWILAILIFTLAVIYEEKKLKIAKKIIKKIMHRKG